MWIRKQTVDEMLKGWRQAQQDTLAALRDHAAVITGAATHREERLREDREVVMEQARAERDLGEEQFHTLSARIGDLEKRCAAAESAKVLLQEQLRVAQNNFEWARLRLNQIESERALLFDRVLNVQFPALELARGLGRADVPPAETVDPYAPLPGILDGLGMSASIFEDLGDEQARAQGLAHDDDGAVVEKH